MFFFIYLLTRSFAGSSILKLSYFFVNLIYLYLIYLIMPRQARKRSITAIYHVILRGIDKMSLFYDDNDRKLFLKQLKLQACPGFEIYCYCLMTNHIHLLVKSNLLSQYMHHIAFAYAMWFNSKYGRKGYLFQDRFRSEGIETENYLIQCFRYILQNPVKAGICKRVSDYRWSSYRLYYDSTASFVNVGFIKKFFPDRIQFEKYLLEIDQTSFMEYLSERQMREEELRQILKELVGEQDIHALPKEEQKRILRQMLRKTNAGLRQLARITGMSIGIIRYLKEGERAGKNYTLGHVPNV